MAVEKEEDSTHDGHMKYENPDDELAQHLNQNAKQGTMEQPDLQGCGQ
jgi:hypothetical protein